LLNASSVGAKIVNGPFDFKLSNNLADSKALNNMALSLDCNKLSLIFLEEYIDEAPIFILLPFWATAKTEIRQQKLNKKILLLDFIFFSLLAKLRINK